MAIVYDLDKCLYYRKIPAKTGGYGTLSKLK